MESQFAHIESFSIKKNPKSKKTDVAGVCGEVTRQPGFCEHVDEVQKPDLLYGMDPLALQAKINIRFDELREESKGSGVAGPRKDRLVLTAGVFSYPGTECDEKYFEWQADCVKYLKSEYGQNLKSVVAHYDEGHPHLHFLLCDLKTLRVDGGLDPAKTAQHEHRQLKKTNTTSQKDALKTFQDRFYDQVGEKYGHERKLGSRERLRGSPKAVRAILAEMKAIEAEKASLETQKLNIEAEKAKAEAQKIQLKETNQRLKEKATAVLLLEKRFSGGLDAIDQEFQKWSLREKEAQRVGDFAKAEQAQKMMFQMREDVMASPHLVAGFQKRTPKPAWFR
jgi:hypothetical protein